MGDFKQLIQSIEYAQVEAAESVVVEGLRKEGLLPPEPPYAGTPHPAELGVIAVCDPCGSIIKAEWVVHDENPKQAILCVEKCRCDVAPWQPIETAPKDGTPVLLVWHWDSGIHKGVTVVLADWGCVAHSHLSRVRDCPNEPDCKMTWGVYSGEFTHWMPLPDLPEVKD